jgi:ABC transport system ATP-binding/permease protein
MTAERGLLCRHEGREVWLDPRRQAWIGTDASCEVVLDQPDYGVKWAAMRMVGGWHVRPLDGTEVALDNGLWRGRPAWIEGEGPVLVRLRRDGHEARLEVRYAAAGPGGPRQPFPDPAPTAVPPRPAPPRPPARIAATVDPGVWQVIGREGGDADVQLPGLDVALRHARVRRRPDGSVDIRDLSHGLGVFVAGRHVISHLLRPGESFVIGHHRLLVGAQGVMVDTVRRSPVLQCRELTVTYQDREKASLTGIEFELDDHGFLTVIGPSGAGKSTLFRALLGEIADVSGSVSFAGDALSPTGLPGSLVSFVPQDDDLPSDLTVRQAMRFTARLRLAADLRRAELAKRTEDVMTRLGLTDHADTTIAALSGGTRKRVSVAMELLSDPIVLILDEPTSGLDEGLDRRLMRQMASLARSGTAILVVTHSMVNLGESDQVLAITARGASGYVGPPHEMRAAFGAQTFADVMDTLRAGQSSGVRPVRNNAATAPRSQLRPDPVPRNQTAVLTARELRRLAPTASAGRGRRLPAVVRSAQHLLLAPLLIAVLACLAGSGGLAATPRHPNNQLTVVLCVLSITTAFFAAALTSGSIVSDYAVIKREARWGIRAGSVIMSRFVVFGTAGAIQGALATVFFLAFRPGPSYDQPVTGWVLLLVSLCLLCVASAAAGLFISALSRTVQQGVFALMMLSVTQVVLSGLIITLGSPGNVGDLMLAWLSWLMPIRWAVAGLGAGMNLNAVPGISRDGLWSHDLFHVAGAWVALAVLTGVFLVAAQKVLTKRLRRRL